MCLYFVSLLCIFTFDYVCPTRSLLGIVFVSLLGDASLLDRVNIVLVGLLSIKYIAPSICVVNRKGCPEGSPGEA